MRKMEFKMERSGLLEKGDKVTVTEGVLPSNYYYTIDPSLAMSGNFPFSERMTAREGIVISVEERSAGFYVTVLGSVSKSVKYDTVPSTFSLSTA